MSKEWDPEKQTNAPDLELNGFSPTEVIDIEACSMPKAFHKLGELTNTNTYRALSRLIVCDNYQEKLSEAAHSFEFMESLAKKGLCTTSDGINHLQQFLDCFFSFCEGAGISPEEGALLMLEDQGGCQTVVIQNSYSEEIAVMHMEEDCAEAARSGDANTDKKIVTIQLPDRTVTFCMYPGVLSLGTTHGLVTKQNGDQFFQAADTLDFDVHGNVFWANALAFILFHCASLEHINEILSQLQHYPELLFAGAYAVHMIEFSSKKGKQLRSIEFGGPYIRDIPPAYKNGCSVVAGVNFPQDQEMADYREKNVSRQNNLMMKERLRALIQMGIDLGRHDQEPGEWGSRAVLQGFNNTLQCPRNIHSDCVWGLGNPHVAQRSILYFPSKGCAKMQIHRHSKR